nr:ribonuclease H-like domain-containing protein [Tanacetum cinerariifolium]
MLAIPDEHLLKFHACKDAKSLWEAIKNSQEGLDKTYDRFQKLISQLEIHGEVISQDDANLKLLRSLPSAWNNIALIMRNKSDLDTLSMDDLYNNLKVYESKIKGQSKMDLKWQVAMLTMRVKRFIKKTRRKLDLNGKETVGFDKTKVECYNFHRRGHFARECRAQRNQGNRNRDAPTRNAQVDTSTTNALVVQDGIGYQMGLESLEAEIDVHEKNEAVYEEDIAFLKYDIRVKDLSIKDLKNPNVNNALPTTYSYFKAHSPVRRPFIQKLASKTNNFNEKGNTAKVSNVTTAGPKVVVSAAEGKRNNAVKSSACWIWRPKGNLIDHISKDSGSYTLKIFNYVDPQGRLKHMTGNKSYLTDYQEINGGFVAFGGNAKGDQVDSFARASSSAGVKHLIPSRLTRYLNLSSGKALVNRSGLHEMAMATFESQYIVQTSGSGITNLLAVGTTFIGSGNLYCQWELSPGSGNALCILFPTILP